MVGNVVWLDTKKNLCAIILKNGSMNGPLNFSYKNGERSYLELGDTIY